MSMFFLDFNILLKTINILLSKLKETELQNLEVDSETCQTHTMNFFAKIVNG